MSGSKPVRGEAVVVPFPGQPPVPAPDVLDGELVDDTDQRVYQPGEEIELPGQREPAERVARARAGAPVPRPWQQLPERRPVVPEWVRDREQRRSAERWLAGHVRHTAAFHTVRSPLYAGRLTWWSVRGAPRLVRRAVRWSLDADMRVLRLEAIRRGDADQLMKLDRERKARTKPRLIGLGVVVLALLVAGVLLATLGPWWAQALAVAAVVGLLAWGGRPGDRGLLDAPVLTSKVRKLSPDIVLRAFLAAGLCKEDSPIGFATPIHRDANGWRVVIDLPYGTSAAKAMTKRVEIASGLDVDERQVFMSRIRGVSGLGPAG